MLVNLKGKKQSSEKALDLKKKKVHVLKLN